ncbi:ABC transporter ATP-binding protein [Agromyces intestinalis]|uniref:ABC transporter ATP-binding protein n=1 Tax=Agromyces intestinalis TaxID=2592652 RepID=A0A5C1YHG1_9MICO|nr:ABC transporter ATP-binding protein [Agromyces intestinalis]QEO14840.1 ABC transporter ATP-binding protein [Agromyces intestinalis]
MAIRGRERVVASEDDLNAIRTRHPFRTGLAGLARGGATEPGTFAVSIAAALVQCGSLVVASVGLGWVTDTVIEPSFAAGEVGAGALWAAFAVVFGLAAMKVTGLVVRRVASGITQFRVQARSRRQVTRQYLALGFGWHLRHPPGRLLSNAVSDVEAMWQPIMPLPFAIGVTFMLVAAAVTVAFADVVLALVTLALIVAIVGVNLWYQRVLAPRARRAQQLRGSVSAIAHESFDGAEVVRTLGLADHELERFGAAARELRDANVRSGRITSLFDPVIEFLPTVAVLGVLLLGCARVADGDLSAGELVQVAYLFVTMAFPLQVIGRVLSALPMSVVGRERVEAVLRADEFPEYGERDLDPEGAGAALDARGIALDARGIAVDARGIGFGYPGGRPVLRDLDLGAEPGRVVALVGPTGSGKSTLVQVLDRLVDPEEGIVRLDGEDARSYAPGRIAAAVGLAPQHAFLFDDSVRFNVDLGRGYGDDRIWEALRAASADSFVAALPDGLDADLGERGATLSGGQKQRLVLARALVSRPRLLLLDDATSALDARVEREVIGRLALATRSGAAGRLTVVIVASRASSIALADEIVFLDGGRIVARGTHDELVLAAPGYRELVEAYGSAIAVDELTRAAVHA